MQFVRTPCLLVHARTVYVHNNTLSQKLATSYQARFLASNGGGYSQSALTNKKPIVVTGPSGSGKSTLIGRLFKEYPLTFGFSVSHTTRKPRPGEADGVAYHFVSDESMQNLISQGYFLEHAEFSGNSYGTSKKAVQDVADQGKICILDVDLQGVRRIRESDISARYIFIRPESLEILEKRLRDRGTETEEAVQKRLSRATKEWEFGMNPGNFDHIVVNDTLDRAYKDLCQFIFLSKK